MNKNKSQSAAGRAVKDYFSQNWGILAGLGILIIVFSIFGNNFLTQKNLLNLLRTCATNCYLAIGVQMAIILAGIDLTGGALAALSGVMTVAAFQWWGMPVQIAVVLGVLIGLVIGFLNGFIVAYTGIHPFVVTLAMQSICRGTAYLVANGSPVTAYGNDAFAVIGQGSLGPVPLPVIYMIIFLVLDFLFLNKTKTGRYIYAVGGNEVSARFSGINVKKIKILVWTISGILAGFCGVVLASRLASGQPATGEGYETDAIAAAVLGGTSFFGGTGSVGGLLIGVLIIGLISNGLNLMHVNSYWQFVLKGIIIIAAVYVDMMKQRKQNSAK
ncbi:ABC transporter permease [Parablautia sp. Marseille-Q6255]|uniref:ABC transporter permease n=1 Tax=Parablautia sp. Marseille-Q6255 TaxID=3039593 RepID=UPI0024BC43D7|nr:ABC transporter permease [Parablautia sp. Marseille-Q6255]